MLPSIIHPGPKWWIDLPTLPSSSCETLRLYFLFTQTVQYLLLVVLDHQKFIFWDLLLRFQRKGKVHRKVIVNTSQIFATDN